MDSTGEPSSSRPAQSSSIAEDEALAALLYTVISSSLSTGSRRGIDASTAPEAIPLSEINDSRKGKAPARVPVSESHQSPSVPPALFAALLQSLVNSDSTQPQPNGEFEVSSNGNPVQSPSSTDNVQSANNLFFPTSTRSLPPHPVFVEVHERLRSRSTIPKSNPDESDGEATVMDEDNDPSDGENYPRNLPSYHCDEDFGRYWAVPLEMQDGRKFCLDFTDIRGPYFSRNFYPRIVFDVYFNRGSICGAGDKYRQITRIIAIPTPNQIHVSLFPLT